MDMVLEHLLISPYKINNIVFLTNSCNDFEHSTSFEFLVNMLTLKSLKNKKYALNKYFWLYPPTK